MTFTGYKFGKYIIVSKKWKAPMVNLITQIVIVNLYIFALGLFTFG